VTAAARPDLILLDVMMPDADGFEVIRQIRSSGPRIPVIFLTARDAVRDPVAGLTLGGDDYITKPFSLDEVLARIRAVLRRSAGDGEPTAQRLVVADLELDSSSYEVWRAGRPVSLTPTEFRLLRYLMVNAGQVLSKRRSSTMSGIMISAAMAMSSSPVSATCGARPTTASRG